MFPSEDGEAIAYLFGLTGDRASVVVDFSGERPCRVALALHNLGDE